LQESIPSSDVMTTKKISDKLHGNPMNFNSFENYMQSVPVKATSKKKNAASKKNKKETLASSSSDEDVAESADVKANLERYEKALEKKKRELKEVSFIINIY